MAAQLKADTDKWGDIIRIANIEKQQRAHGAHLHQNRRKKSAEIGGKTRASLNPMSAIMRSNGGMDQALALIVAALLSTSSAGAVDQVQLAQVQLDRPQTETMSAQNCDIKGNVAASGERIYHVPGGEYYAVTRVNPAKGERWFCSEAEARAAGWRRSKR